MAQGHGAAQTGKKTEQYLLGPRPPQRQSQYKQSGTEHDGAPHGIGHAGVFLGVQQNQHFGRALVNLHQTELHEWAGLKPQLNVCCGIGQRKKRGAAPVENSGLSDGQLGQGQ